MILIVYLIIIIVNVYIASRFLAGSIQRTISKALPFIIIILIFSNGVIVINLTEEEKVFEFNINKLFEEVGLGVEGSNNIVLSDEEPDGGVINSPTVTIHMPDRCIQEYIERGYDNVSAEQLCKIMRRNDLQ